MALIDEHPLRTIRNDRELRKACKMLDSLLARDELSHWEEAYVDALAVFIEKYEAEHHAIRPPADRELLRELIESITVTPSDDGIQVELIGDIVNMIELPETSGRSVPDLYRSSVKVVAGARYPLFRTSVSCFIPTVLPDTL